MTGTFFVKADIGEFVAPWGYGGITIPEVHMSQTVLQKSSQLAVAIALGMAIGLVIAEVILSAT